jgi:hypothetical protein
MRSCKANNDSHNNIQVASKRCCVGDEGQKCVSSSILGVTVFRAHTGQGMVPNDVAQVMIVNRMCLIPF